LAKDAAKKKERAKGARRAEPARPSDDRAASSATGSDEAIVAESLGAAGMGPIASRPALPQTREELLDLWNQARRRRHSAPLGSEEFVQASEDVARLEVAIAAAERSMTPPRV
jgi:hypothetical protein